VTDHAPIAEPAWLVRELRSDIAGEAGAVAIYQGILSVARDPRIRSFALAHLATEREHLELVSSLLARRDHSVLMVFWRLAGFLTGFFPGLFGAAAVYRTIDSVETFVDLHYQTQIDRLRDEGIYPEICTCLEACRQDEVKHRNEARDCISSIPGPLARIWCQAVATGSSAAVAAARQI
jgi:3-demethoxyubiquinol 3-hydroxylase